MLDRSINMTGRDFARASVTRAPTPPVLDAPAHQGRGTGALMLADQIAARARALGGVTREDVTPDLEPLNASQQSGEEFDETANDHDPDENLEPLDPTIESALQAKATVEEHEDGSVTIHPEGDEVLDASEVAGGDVIVHVEP